MLNLLFETMVISLWPSKKYDNIDDLGQHLLR